MTVSRNIGRGGKRTGSGRKRKPTAPPLTNIPATSGQAAQLLAKRDVDLAIATLVHIATNGESESARVSAAKYIIEIAGGKPKANQPDTEDSTSDGWDSLLDRRQRARRVN
jgi:hypothetical protein